LLGATPHLFEPRTQLQESDLKISDLKAIYRFQGLPRFLGDGRHWADCPEHERRFFWNRAVENLPFQVLYGVSDISDAISYTIFYKPRFRGDEIFQGLRYIRATTDFEHTPHGAMHVCQARLKTSTGQVVRTKRDC